jgi:hypothetical protein
MARELFTQAGLRVERVSFLFGTLFPLMLISQAGAAARFAVSWSPGMTQTLRCRQRRSMRC